MAAQYTFQFHSESEALHFVRSATLKFRDIAILRSGAWVSIIDGTGDREEELLAMARRVRDVL